jgi:Ribonuclease D
VITEAVEPAVSYPVLARPAEGIPPIVDSAAALAASRAALAGGHGPVGVDTERAHGYRYSAKAYLIQLRRDGGGTHLIDPIAFEDGHPRADLSALADDLADVDWILHAASQDLPCLAEVKLLPRQLFDTELAARLLGLPRVNLSALMEQALGLSLAKEHSAADWSRRPIPEDWLNYAALDVERLGELREWQIERLTEAGKLDWALQEFRHLAEHAADPAVARTDPWRRTHGLHTLRSLLGLAVARELWQTREELARAEDRAPGRVLPDRNIVEVARAVESSRERAYDRSWLRAVPGFAKRSALRNEQHWLAAIRQATQLPKSELPARHLVPDGPPQPRAWERRWPDSFARFNRVRPALIELSESLQLPVENLLSPDHLRRLLWDSPATIDASEVEEKLAGFGARQWQRELVTPVITQLW